MTIFKYELRQLLTYTLWWTIACALLIFSMFPVYLGFMTSDIVNMSQIAENPLFTMLGVDIQVITTPIGTLGFLTSFFAIGAGINGMHLGLKTFTKETIGKSAEYLYTKPYKRSRIYTAKVLSALTSALITGIGFCAGALLTAAGSIQNSHDMRLFSLTALSFLLIEIFFVLFGSMIGVLYSKIRTPLLVSAGGAFLFYVLSAFASKVNSFPIKLLTPYSYFGVSSIVKNEGFSFLYLAAFLIFSILFTAVGLCTFLKKDTTLIS